MGCARWKVKSAKKLSVSKRVFLNKPILDCEFDSLACCRVSFDPDENEWYEGCLPISSDGKIFDVCPRFKAGLPPASFVKECYDKEN